MVTGVVQGSLNLFQIIINAEKTNQVTALTKLSEIHITIKPVC